MQRSNQKEIVLFLVTHEEALKLAKRKAASHNDRQRPHDRSMDGSRGEPQAVMVVWTDENGDVCCKTNCSHTQSIAWLIREGFGDSAIMEASNEIPCKLSDCLCRASLRPGNRFRAERNRTGRIHFSGQIPADRRGNFTRRVPAARTTCKTPLLRRDQTDIFCESRSVAIFSSSTRRGHSSNRTTAGRAGRLDGLDVLYQGIQSHRTLADVVVEELHDGWPCSSLLAASHGQRS